ncbi:MAG: hypothetical protein OWQ54_04545 [Sulfolobaceae archaeon]|nr:hypothetical protein [Sulfolobaceae archaeon]
MDEIRPLLLPIVVLLPLIPFIILTIQGDTTLGLIGLITIVAFEGIGVLKDSFHYASWASIVIAAIISITSQGYIPYLIHIALVRNQDVALFDGSIIAPEYAMVLSYLYRSYSRYNKELNVKGFDKEEVNRELNSLSISLLLILTSALLVSILVYYIILISTISIIDPFTALVISAIVFILIARYITNKIRSSYSR